ncbi:MAG: hypothetical protein IPH72_08770 [Sandaracinaceae bacterium]|jgi:hypothetical protein|nr:hypothetical protein [Sandaracinaceae bacterium]
MRAQTPTTPTSAHARRVCASLVVLAALCCSLPRARACQLPPAFAYATTWPALGTLGVPTNVVIEVLYIIEEPNGTRPPPLCLGADASAAYTIRLVDGGAPLDHSLVSVASGTEIRQQLVLDAPLSPGTQYEVVGPSCDEEGVVLTRFTTGLEADTTPPTLSSASWGCTVVHHDLQPVGTCEYGMERIALTPLTLLARDETNLVRVELHATEASTLPFARLHRSSVLVAELSQWPGEGSWAQGLPTFVDYGVPPGAWKLVAVDAAGNRSAPVVLDAPLLCPGSTLDGGVRPEPTDGGSGVTHGSGCTAGRDRSALTGAPSLALGVLALAWRRRRLRGTTE